jgi:putative transposase
MKKSRFSEEQIIGFIKQAAAGVPIKQVCRKGGFSEATSYKWRAKYGGMDVPDAKRQARAGSNRLESHSLAGKGNCVSVTHL